MRLTKLCIMMVLAFMSGTRLAKAQYRQATVTHVYFRFNADEIDSAQRGPLNNMAAKLAKSKAPYRIIVSGYCDSVSDDMYNDALSMRRADAVRDYLVKKGINPANIFAIKAFGKRKPMNANKTEAERQQNRRVDIMVQFDGGKSNLIKTNGLAGLKMDSVKTGSHIMLRNLNFYGGLHRLLPGSVPVLDTLVNILKQNPGLRICIQGHVCCTANGEDGADNETMTYDLSWNRAKEVYHYLIAKSISPARLSFIGMGGKNHLVDPEITEDDRTQNRRVEIVVVEK